ncbi:MAG: Holliday junction resolvase RuvX [Paludibacteraceae bacterium]
MGRILAFDFGRKRTGLAVTDVLRISANGLETLPTYEVLPFVEKYIAKETVDLFIIGKPLKMNGEDSESARYLKPFADRLQKKFPHIELIYVDERFTSVLAHRTMIEGGLKKKDRQNKALVDKISATIILQTYLESCCSSPIS